MKRRLGNLILLLISAAGLTLLLYPQISNLWNQRTSSRAIASYTESIAQLDEENYVALWQAAQEFNAKLQSFGGYELPEDLLADYTAALDVTGLGIMGYVEIPSLDVSLPIYHGTDEGILQIALGHLAWSSLPIGGEGNHTVICGHRGLPSAKLFDDLPKMALGDIFYIRVLDELLTYEVDQILTVLPDDLSSLNREADKDYCTLFTCTPYGINTHRLLVRGHRIADTGETDQKNVFVVSEAAIVEPLIVAPIFALPMLLFLLAILFFNGRKRKNNNRK